MDEKHDIGNRGFQIVLGALAGIGLVVIFHGNQIFIPILGAACVLGIFLVVLSFKRLKDSTDALKRRYPNNFVDGDFRIHSHRPERETLGGLETDSQDHEPLFLDSEDSVPPIPKVTGYGGVAGFYDTLPRGGPPKTD